MREARCMRARLNWVMMVCSSGMQRRWLQKTGSWEAPCQGCCAAESLSAWRRFDEEKCLKHQWVGRGADGFPSLEGNTEEILGNELCIRYNLWPTSCNREENSRQMIFSAAIAIAALCIVLLIQGMAGNMEIRKFKLS